MTEQPNSPLTAIKARIKRLQQREAELVRWILDHPEDRWGENISLMSMAIKSSQ